jgi:hypothetical protein
MLGNRVEPATLHRRALEDLSFIRDTMASVSGYTTFSGRGLLVVGLGALITGVMATQAPPGLAQVQVWLIDAVISVGIGIASVILKANVARQPLFAGPVRKFSIGFLPAVLAGAALSLQMIRDGAWERLPGIWLLAYGTALLSAGATSVAIISIMGGAFFVLGCTALFGSAAWGNALLMLGFGGLHLCFGALIVRRYGG